METRILRKTALLCGILLIGILIMGQSAMAAKWGDTPSGQDCIITEVFVNFNAENDPITVNIYGQNFECENLIITLGDYGSLNVTSCLPDPDNEITIELPTGIQDGEYLLNIQTGSSVHQYDTYNLTIGAVGPEGPRGEVGPQGPQGIQGSQGEQGLTGATGAQGSQGEQGLTGATGAQGSQGEQGLTGATGAQGSQGEQGLTGATGAQGSQGEQGPQGEPGNDGRTVAIFTGITTHQNDTRIHDLYTQQNHSSSYLEITALVHDLNSNTYRKYLHREYAVYRQWYNAPTISTIGTVANVGTAFTIDVIASGNDIQVELIHVTPISTNTRYKIIAKWFAP